MSYYKSERIIPVWVKVMLSLFIFLLLFMFAVFLIKEIDFKNTPYVEQECRLLSIEYSPSTEKTRLAPIIGGSTSVAMYTTGTPEMKITIWDCGKYGRLNSDDNNVYRFAKEVSILYIKSNDYDTRIVGIKNAVD